MDSGISRRRRAGATLAVTALLTMGAIVPAAAEIDRHRDPAEDVVRISDSGGGDAPYHRRADILRFVTDHDGWRLRIVVELRNIRMQFSVAATIKTPDATFHGGVAWRRGEYLLVDLYRGGSKLCTQGIEGRVDRESDTVTYLVPRRCLGKPRWVRTAVVAFAFRDPDKHVTYFADDGRTDERYIDGDFPLLGGRIHHN